MDVLVSMSMFRRVVEAGSFSAVAAETGSSQSTVSKHVAALEQRLGTKLLNRSTRQLHVTEAGQDYYRHCLRILDDVAESEASVRHGQSRPVGKLRVAAPVMFGRLFIAPLLWAFMREHPEVSIDLTMDDRHIDLIKEGVDVAVRAGKLADSNLVARKLGPFPPQILVASPAYLAERGEPQTPADLMQHDCLLHSLLTPANEWTFTGPEGEETVHVPSRFVSNNRDTLNDAALAGMGIAITWLWPNRALIEQGRLKCVLSDYSLSTLDFYVLFPERQLVPQKVRSLIEHLSAYFAAPDRFQNIIEQAAYTRTS